MEFALKWGGVSKRKGIDQHRAGGDSRLATMEPTPAQRKDSVLRRDMKGSVLTFCSATHSHKLINLWSPELQSPRTRSDSPSGHFAPDSSHSGLFLPDFNRLGVKGSVGILQNGLDRRFPRVGRQNRGRSDGGKHPKRKATILRCQPSAIGAPAAMKCTRRPVSSPSRR